MRKNWQGNQNFLLKIIKKIYDYLKEDIGVKNREVTHSQMYDR